MLSMIDPLDKKTVVPTLNVSLSSKLRESLLLGIVNDGSPVYNLNIFFQSFKADIEYSCIGFKWLGFFS